MQILCTWFLLERKIYRPAFILAFTLFLFSHLKYEIQHVGLYGNVIILMNKYTFYFIYNTLFSFNLVHQSCIKSNIFELRDTEHCMMF